MCNFAGLIYKVRIFPGCMLRKKATGAALGCVGRTAKSGVNVVCGTESLLISQKSA